MTLLHLRRTQNQLQRMLIPLVLARIRELSREPESMLATSWSLRHWRQRLTQA